MARKLADAVPDYNDFIGSKDIDGKTFLIVNARHAAIDKRQGKGPEDNILFTIADATGALRDFTLSPNGYRERFVQAFKDAPGQSIGPVSITKEKDESKGAGKGAEVWTFHDSDSALDTFPPAEKKTK
jgi:hypothetical protein